MPMSLFALGTSGGYVPVILAALGLLVLSRVDQPSRGWGQPRQAEPVGDTRAETPPKAEDSEKEQLATLLQEEIRLAELLVQAFPGSVDSLAVMGNVHARHGNTDQAIGLWRKAAKIDPKRVELYAKIANLASQTDQYETVIAMWRKVLEIAPSQRGASYEIANAHMQLGDYEACIKKIHEEMELSGETAKSCFLLGQAYQQRQEYEKAKDSFRRVIELEPDHRQAYYGLYGVSVRLKQREEAKQHLAKFRELKSDHQEAIREADESMLTDLECFYVGLANFCSDVQELRRKTGESQVTEKVLETALKLGRHNVVFLNRLAVRYSTTNRVAGAMALYRQIARLDPENASCHLNMGILAIKAGRADMAEAEFRKAIELAPGNYAGYQELARLYLRIRRNLAEARQLAQKAVALEASGDTYYDLGLAHLANDDLDSALAALEEALELEPTNPTYARVHDLVSKRKTRP
jgi:tetratricopeptide (TPR) repeat protein